QFNSRTGRETSKRSRTRTDRARSLREGDSAAGSRRGDRFARELPVWEDQSSHRARQSEHAVYLSDRVLSGAGRFREEPGRARAGRWRGDLKMTRRSVIICSSAAVAVVLIIGTLSARRISSNSSTSSAKSSVTSEMQGMAGMNAQPAGSVSITLDQIRQFGITFG